MSSYHLFLLIFGVCSYMGTAISSVTANMEESSCLHDKIEKIEVYKCHIYPRSIYQCTANHKNITSNSVKKHVGGYDAAPCKADDDDCLKDFVSELVKTTLNGVPELGIETFDPYRIDEFDTNLADVNLVFKNVTTLGIKKCEVTSLSTSSGSIKYDLLCPALNMRSNYEGSGKFSLIYMHGKGDITFSTGKILISMESEYKKQQNSDGKNCFQFKNKKFTATALDPIKFDITNLFDGQKELSDAFLKFAHENWKLLSEILLVPILKPSMQRLIKSENIYLKNKKSYEEVIKE